MSQIVINKDFYLVEPGEADVLHMVQHMNHIEHYNNTLRIPFPYEEKHAYDFIAFVRDLKSKYERPMCWHIKNQSNMLVGGIGLLGVYGKDSHKDELGYWIAKPLWNKGIATLVVSMFCNYIFEHYNLARIEAHVFAHNLPSMRVLEKCGFIREGLRQKCFLKNNSFIDAVAFALIKK